MNRYTPIIVKDQLPDFVTEDHPRFVSFLEAYYEFLDGSDITNINDIDKSLEEFEDNFYNSFIPYIPRDTKINKEFIFKNIMPLFLAKGSEKSFKYFFRLLFDQDIEIKYPSKSILKASDGKWSKENILRLNDAIYSEYISDGLEKTYNLPGIYDRSDLTVFLDGLEVTDYLVYPEYYKLQFLLDIPEGTAIKVVYNSFQVSLFQNRNLRGLESGATAITEKVGTRNSSDIKFYEFLINDKTLSGNFKNGEFLYTDVIVNGNLIPVTLETFANIEDIIVLTQGTSYNIGDPVVIRGDATRTAIAIIDDVTSGVIENVTITKSGSGFKVNEEIYAEGYTPESFSSHIVSVDDSGLSSCNTITYNTDLISNLESTLIGASDYLLSANVTNLSSQISDALNTTIIDHLGGATQVAVDTSYISSSLKPTLYVNPYILFSNTSIKDLGVIGKVEILDGGSGYSVGDLLTFTNTVDFSGQGANAYVSDVSASGAIEFIRFNDGGLGYHNEALPTITVNSSGGAGANIVVSGIMGTGELLTPVTSNVPYGSIKSIRVLDSGIGYTQVPIIDLSGYGDGTAIAEATIRNSYIELDGKWVSQDSLLSTEGIVLQGKDYYIDYSYIIRVEEEFSKFKDILKKTIHPAGTVGYSQYLLKSDIDITTNLSSSSSVKMYYPDPVLFFNGYDLEGAQSTTILVDAVYAPSANDTLSVAYGYVYPERNSDLITLYGSNYQPTPNTGYMAADGTVHPTVNGNASIDGISCRSVTLPTITSGDGYTYSRATVSGTSAFVVYNTIPDFANTFFEYSIDFRLSRDLISDEYFGIRVTGNQGFGDIIYPRANTSLNAANSFITFNHTNKFASNTTSAEYFVVQDGKLYSPLTVYFNNLKFRQKTQYFEEPVSDLIEYTEQTTRVGLNDFQDFEVGDTFKKYSLAPSEVPMIEFCPSATNLLSYSQDFDNSSWGKTGAILSTSQIIAPNGLNGWKFYETSTLSHHLIEKSLSLNGTERRFSFFAKAAERTVCRGWSWAGGDTNQQTFDLIHGLCYGTLQPKMVKFSNGWWRCSFIVPKENTNTVVFGPSDGIVVSENQYTGDSSKGIYVWGAQLEGTSSETAYIQTGSASATRTTTALSYPSEGHLASNDQAFMYTIIPRSSNQTGVIFNSQEDIKNRTTLYIYPEYLELVAIKEGLKVGGSIMMYTHKADTPFQLMYTKSSKDGIHISTREHNNGTKLVTTVADGAELGNELFPQPTLDSSDGVTLDPGWSIGGGVATHVSGTGGYISIGSDVIFTGKKYQISFNVLSISGGSIALIGVYWGSPQINVSSPGSYSFEVYSLLGYENIIYAGSPVNCIIDNISVKEVLPTYVSIPPAWGNWTNGGASLMTEDLAIGSEYSLGSGVGYGFYGNISEVDGKLIPYYVENSMGWAKEAYDVVTEVEYEDPTIMTLTYSGVTAVSTTIQTSTDPITVVWGDGTSNTYQSLVDVASNHTYSSSTTTYRVKFQGKDDGVLRNYYNATSSLKTSGPLSMPSSLTSFYCAGSNTLTGTLSMPSSLTYFACTGSNTLSGTLSMPSNMTHFSCGGNNILSGTLNMSSVLTYFACSGSNTLTGTLSIPSGMTSFYCAGSNTLTGTLSMPSSLTSFACYGSNTLSGTLSMPSNMTYFSCGGNNILSGTLNMSSVLTSFACSGSNTLTGTLSMPSSLTSFYCAGSNTLTGTLSMPSSLTYFTCWGSNTLSGTLSMPSSLTSFTCYGSNTLSGYTRSTKANNQNHFQLEGLNTMSSTDVDNILLDYAEVATWAGDKYFKLQGNAANRTSASDAAYATLQTKGLTTLSVD